MTKIYLVYGNTGCYEDYVEWIVKAFKSKQKADDLLTELQSMAKKFNSEFINENCLDRIKISSQMFKNLDEKAYSDYNGIYYDLTEVDLDEEC